MTVEEILESLEEAKQRLTVSTAAFRDLSRADKERLVAMLRLGDEMSQLAAERFAQELLEPARLGVGLVGMGRGVSRS